MIQTLEAVVDKTGKVNLLTEIRLKESRRAIVTILDEKPNISETALLSEKALAEDWLREEEDEAWAYIQSEK
ncbi:hypothetical protein BH10ACI1_BH10ACI1_20180 [soil metagenome]